MAALVVAGLEVVPVVEWEFAFVVVGVAAAADVAVVVAVVGVAYVDAVATDS